MNIGRVSKRQLGALNVGYRGEPRLIDRFTGSFVEEIGKGAARVEIALVVVAASGYILLPS